MSVFPWLQKVLSLSLAVSIIIIIIIIIIYYCNNYYKGCKVAPPTSKKKIFFETIKEPDCMQRSCYWNLILPIYLSQKRCACLFFVLPLYCKFRVYSKKHVKKERSRERAELAKAWNLLDPLGRGELAWWLFQTWETHAFFSVCFERICHRFWKPFIIKRRWLCLST